MTNSEHERNSHESPGGPQGEAKHHHRPEVQAAPEIPPAPPRRALMIVGVALIVLLVAGLITLITHTRASHALAKETQASAVPYVAVVHPVMEKPDEDLTLPATLQAYKESPIFARTSGYLVQWYKDIGSMPMIMASAVIITGRSRVRPAARAASWAFMPWSLR